MSSEFRGDLAMEPEIVKRDAFIVMGIAERVAPTEEDATTYERIWRRFEGLHDQIKQHSTDQAYYGVSFATDEEGVFDYVAGMAVEKVLATSADLVIREVPAARCAVFECPIEHIGETYRCIFGEWFPKSPYAVDGVAPSLERYPPVGEEGVPIQIHIPVTERS